MAKKGRRASNTDKTEEFEQFYSRMYPRRWAELKQAMQGSQSYHRLVAGLRSEYFLDPASYLSGSYLEARVEHRILDLCAAPGGKTLVILSNMLAEAAAAAPELALQECASRLDFTANERSASRRGRLKTVLHSHLPEEVAQVVKVRGHDAARWGQIEPEAYDRIMLDVPCSSERHVLKSPKHLGQWSPSRSHRLAQQAYSFLLSALQALKPGGLVVYSTCALSTGENDGVIDRVMSRAQKKGDMSIMTDNRRIIAGPYAALAPEYEGKGADGVGRPLPEWVEETALGFAVLPDKAAGRGPMYFSRLKKL